MRFVLVILCCLGLGSVLKAQDLRGQWTGETTDNLSDIKQKLVLNIASGDSLFGGVLHWYYPENQTIRHFFVSGLYHARDSILFLLENGATSSQAGYPTKSSEEQAGKEDIAANGGRGIFVLHYRRVAHKEVLEGHWRDPDANNESTGSLSGRGITIRLEKKGPPFIPLPPITHKKKDSAQQKQYTELQARESPLVATIPIRLQDSVRIDLYDNGEIDGDSVSLYLNNQLILTHLKLQAQPKTVWLPIDRSLPVNKLILFAENLGRLPPNTALMEVTLNGKLFNVFLSTDYKRNAMVEFVLGD
jgi:hypothetical protein